MISSKYLKVIVGILLSIVIVFTGIIMVMPKNNSESKSASKEYETKVFNKEAITSINISMDKTKWDKMLKNALKEEYYPCDITINGETFKNVGIRPKGNTSLTQVANSDSDRYSFKIDFDYYVDGQTCFGLDKMVLNNTMSDATYMKEYFAYDLMEYIGVDTPLYAYTDVKVNGEKWGLYLGIEGVENSYAERNYGVDHGQLYKPESMNMGGGKQGEKPNMEGKNMMPPVDNGDKNGFNGEKPIAPPDMNNGEEDNKALNVENKTMNPMPQGGNGCDLVYTDNNISSYSSIFDSSVFKSTASDHNRVIKALKGLSTGKNLEKYVNVDSALRYFAANTVLVNLDSYVSNLKHNYYLYEKNSQISILPWDFNLAFGGFQAGTATKAVNFPIDTPVTGVSLSERPLIGKLLENSTYKNTYHEYLEKLADDYFNSGLFENKVNKIDSLIKDYVKNDPTAFYTYDEYEKSIPVFKEFATLRAKSVKGQLEGTIPSTTTEQNSSKDKLIDASSINLDTLGTQGGDKKQDENKEKNTTEKANGDKTLNLGQPMKKGSTNKEPPSGKKTKKRIVEIMQ